MFLIVIAKNFSLIKTRIKLFISYYCDFCSPNGRIVFLKQLAQNQ